VNWLPLALLVAAIAILVAAEWPRIARRLPAGNRRRRGRRKQPQLRLVVEERDELEDDREAFVASVARDLERLPTIEDRD
jgi:hypothetical protein